MTSRSSRTSSCASASEYNKSLYIILVNTNKIKGYRKMFRKYFQLEESAASPAAYNRIPQKCCALVFSKNRGRIFYARKYFSDVWHFRSLRLGRKQKKKFFKNQPKRTLPRPVISERRKIFENGWILPLWNSKSVKSVFQTVDISLANVLTGRGRNFLKEFFQTPLIFALWNSE